MYTHICTCSIYHIMYTYIMYAIRIIMYMVPPSFAVQVYTYIPPSSRMCIGHVQTQAVNPRPLLLLLLLPPPPIHPFFVFTFLVFPFLSFPFLFLSFFVSLLFLVPCSFLFVLLSLFFPLVLPQV